MTTVKIICVVFFAGLLVICGCSDSSLNAGAGKPCGGQADCASGQVPY